MYQRLQHDEETMQEQATKNAKETTETYARLSHEAKKVEDKKEKQAKRKKEAQKEKQKKLQQKRYAEENRRNTKNSGGIKDGKSKKKKKQTEDGKSNKKWFKVAGIVGLAIVLIVPIFSMGIAAGGGGQGYTITGGYVDSDETLIEINQQYQVREDELQLFINHIPTYYPGYDEYDYNIDEIGHDPYELLSYLSAKFFRLGDRDFYYTFQELLDAQYSITISTTTETREREVERTAHRTIRHADGTVTEEDYTYTTTEEYEVSILHTTLTNRGIDAVANELLNERELQMYNIYQFTQGLRPDLFAAGGGGGSAGIEYEIPPEALSDTQFANMVTEAQRYLGMHYVWGGSSPEEGFDCSGFVSYVINNCGNGWNVGRQTANGLLSCCTPVTREDARPGDLIFFERTYNTAGASHVGIYVGENVMIHCGNPIKFSRIDTTYWTQHFYCFGRLH